MNMNVQVKYADEVAIMRTGNGPRVLYVSSMMGDRDEHFAAGLDALMAAQYDCNWQNQRLILALEGCEVVLTAHHELWRDDNKGVPLLWEVWHAIVHDREFRPELADKEG